MYINIRLFRPVNFFLPNPGTTDVFVSVETNPISCYEVWGKVMFLHVSVILSIGWSASRESVSRGVYRIVCIWGSLHLGKGVCIQRGWTDPPEVGKQAVGILLECFLVLVLFCIILLFYYYIRCNTNVVWLSDIQIDKFGQCLPVPGLEREKEINIIHGRTQDSRRRRRQPSRGSRQHTNLPDFG